MGGKRANRFGLEQLGPEKPFSAVFCKSKELVEFFKETCMGNQTKMEEESTQQGPSIIPNRFRFTLESSMLNTLRVRQKDSLLKRLSAMRGFIEQKVLNAIELGEIGLFRQAERATVYFVDVLVNGDIHFCDLEYISHAVKIALNSLSMPKVNIYKNTLEDKFVFEVESQMTRPFPEFRIRVPEAYLVGAVNGKLVVDLSELELASCDEVFLVVINENEESKGNCIEKLRKFLFDFPGKKLF